MKTLLLALFLTAACCADDRVLFIGGCGGVYFLAEPGELTVEVLKRDRNLRDARTELRAILAGPDRRVVQEATIPDDGKPRGSGLGPVQSCRLSTRVERKGVYVLNITVSNDRYGEHVVWGFRSNCPKYLIETARGHRDAPHEEPIVLASPEQSADVCFLPRLGTFKVEISAAAAAQMFDHTGALLATLDKPSYEFTAKTSAPWRLHFPSAKATIQVDGLTRWNSRDRHPNMTIWTPQITSWFPFLENRWLLTPYSLTLCGQTQQCSKSATTLSANEPFSSTSSRRQNYPQNASLSTQGKPQPSPLWSRLKPPTTTSAPRRWMTAASRGIRRSG